MDERAKKRYDGIDLDRFKRSMTSHEFRAFKDFIGEEDIGLEPEDFEVYYPEEDE